VGSVSAIFSGESPIHHRFLAIIRYLRLVAISLCRWVGVFVFRFGWCWAVLREFVVLPPVEVVVLARFWWLAVVLVLVVSCFVLVLMVVVVGLVFLSFPVSLLFRRGGGLLCFCAAGVV
jgi:hypothetical protein